MKWMVMGNCELQRLDRTCQRPGKVARDCFSGFFFRAIGHFRLPSQDLGFKLRTIVWFDILGLFGNRHFAWRKPF